jgi:hypothetical protein
MRNSGACPPSLNSQEIAEVVRWDAAKASNETTQVAFPLQIAGYTPPLVKRTTSC